MARRKLKPIQFGFGPGGVGANKEVGNGATVGANVNPLTGDVGGSASIQRGNVRAGVDTSGTIKVSSANRVGGDTAVGISGGLNVPTMMPTGGATVTFDSNNPSAQTGAQIGSIVGMTLPGGSLLGSAVGSGIGSLTSSKHRKEKDKREGLLSAYQQMGMFGEDGMLINPDGSTIKISGDGSERHNWKDASKRVDDGGNANDLFQFETDYTNDLDFIAGMGGVNLSRLLAGGTSKDIDQAGAVLGNAALGSVGYGADFNQQNFGTVATNLRARYAASGIKSKDDMIAMANKAYADGRIKDTDYASIKQTADMVFDGNYGLASQLMAGRWDGIKTAAKSPQDSQGTSSGPAPAADPKAPWKPGMARAPHYTPEEYALALKPYTDYARNHSIDASTSDTGVSIGAGLEAIMAGLGIYNRYKKDPNKPGLANTVAGIANTVSGWFGGSDPEYTLPAADVAGSYGVDTTPDISGADSGYQLPAMDPTDISAADSSYTDFLPDLAELSF